MDSKMDSSTDDESFSIEQIPFNELMTSSQYAQIVFHEVCDCYLNDVDLSVSFSVSPHVSHVMSDQGDLIGLYKVPYVSPEQFLLKQPVTLRANQEKQSVAFNKGDLPSDDDFYQFQYLKSDKTVLGASIPFQLRKPLNEEFIAVEKTDADASFMVVQSSTAHATEKLNDRVNSVAKENETLKTDYRELKFKYDNLLGMCEKQTKELKDKTESFTVVEEQYKSMKKDTSNYEQLKTDIVCVLQDKLHLEEKLYKVEKINKELEKEIHELKFSLEVDEIQEGKNRLFAKLSEFASLFEKLRQPLFCNVDEIVNRHYEPDEEIDKKMENVRKMLDSLNVSMEIIRECRLFLLSEDDRVAELLTLKKDLIAERQTSSTLQITLEAIKGRHQGLERNLEAKQREFKLVEQDYDFKLGEEIKNRETAEKKCESYQREIEDRDTTIASLNKRIEVLIRQVDKNGGARPKDLSSFQETLYDGSKLSSFQETLYDGSKRKIHQLETKVLNLEQEVKSLDSNHSSELKQIKSEIDLLKNEDVSRKSFSSDGLSMMEKEIEQLRLDDVARKSPPASTTSRVSSVENFDSLRIDQSVQTALNDKITLRAPSPQIPCSPPTQHRSPFNTATSALMNFMPQFPGSIFNQRQHHHYPPPVQTSVMDEEQRDLSHLNNWVANIQEEEEEEGNEPVVGTPSTISLTDDGRIIVCEDNLICPICDRQFEGNEVRDLEFHVETHLATSLNCPICQESFPLSSQESFEQHVQEHFVSATGDDFVRVEPEEESHPEPTAPPTPRGRQFDGSFGGWELDID